MKKLCIFPLVAALAFFVSCQKQQSEEEKRAEIERQVQDRLAAERQADEKQRLAQQQADLEAREKALADKEAAAASIAQVPAEPPIEAPASVQEPEPEREPEPREDVSEERSSAAYGTFYRKLETYGAWSETTDYGYVWQPREAEDRSWRPYTDGRWVYTDAGWTWVSEEPFGWATYHYGRWVRLRRVGWVWVPGEEWAPAWVSWRTSKDYVGWAPLPPEARFDRKRGIRNWADNYYDIGPDQYAFVPGNEFGSRRIRQSVVPVERNITIVIDTTNVTNITFANTTVVNHGPNFEEMRSRSRQPLERYRLERQASSETTALPTVRGEVLVMSAPAITRVHGIDRPQTVKEKITEATVEKSWSADTDRAASDRARAKMKAEVAAPVDAPSKKFVKPVLSSSPGPMATAAGAAPAASASPALAPANPVAATQTPGTRVRPTPAAIMTPAPTMPAAGATATPASVSPSPRPPLPVTSPEKPVKAIATPAAPLASTTPKQIPQTTPRRIVPTPMITPGAPPNSIAPADTLEKPSPRSNPGPKPVTSPRVTQPLPVVTPPPSAKAPVVPPPPNETKPIVRETPPGFRSKPPTAPTLVPPSSTPARPTQPLPMMTPPPRAKAPVVPPPPNETKPVMRETPPSVKSRPPAAPVLAPPPSAPAPAMENQRPIEKRPSRPEAAEGVKPIPTPLPPK